MASSFGPQAKGNQLASMLVECGTYYGAALSSSLAIDLIESGSGGVPAR
jgi:hypothetical protein